LSIIEFIVYSFSQSLYIVADFFNGNYGFAVIAVTLVIRILLLPLFIKQAKQQKKMRKGLNDLKPELEAIQKKYKNTKLPEEKRKHQEEMILLYTKNNINPLSMGCLPMIVQLPIVLGMYWAVMETSKLSNHFFLWFDFTETSIILAFIAGFIYYVQGKLSQEVTNVLAQPNMQWMMLLSPIIIFVVSITSPAILPFYWSVNGALLIIQTIIVKCIT
jgi:YidC/Oxa1 family membrane protein insertase